MTNPPPAIAVSLASLHTPVQSSFGFMEDASLAFQPISPMPMM